MNYQHKFSDRRDDIAPRGTQSEDFFEGLPEKVTQFSIVQLVENVSRIIGLSSASISHLRYLTTHTHDVDWKAGRAPVVWRSVQDTAAHRGLSVRQIWNLEKNLHKAGLIQWNDRGGNKRYGKRDSRGNIVFAYGVDLSPMAAMYDELVDLNDQHMAYMEAFRTFKRDNSAYRRRILCKIRCINDLSGQCEAYFAQFEALPSIRANAPLDVLEAVLKQSKSFNAKLDEDLQKLRSEADVEEPVNDNGMKESSGSSEINFRHIQPTLSQQSLKRDSNPEGFDDKEDVGEIFSSGLEHITYEMAIDAASGEFLECLVPSDKGDQVTDLITAAARMCHQMGIGRFAWIKACSVMGDNAAAIAVLIIDRNRAHPILPVVNPGGVLRGMTTKAKTGELNLHKSMFAILNRADTEYVFLNKTTAADKEIADAKAAILRIKQEKEDLKAEYESEKISQSLAFEQLYAEEQKGTNDLKELTSLQGKYTKLRRDQEFRKQRVHDIKIEIKSWRKRILAAQKITGGAS